MSQEPQVPLSIRLVLKHHRNASKPTLHAAFQLVSSPGESLRTQEGAVRQRAAERLAVLRREKASLCKKLEAPGWSLARVYGSGLRTLMH